MITKSPLGFNPPAGEAGINSRGFKPPVKLNCNLIVAWWRLSKIKMWICDEKIKMFI